MKVTYFPTKSSLTVKSKSLELLLEKKSKMNIPEIMEMTPNKHDIQFINVRSKSVVECTLTSKSAVYVGLP